MLRSDLCWDFVEKKDAPDEKNSLLKGTCVSTVCETIQNSNDIKWKQVIYEFVDINLVNKGRDTNSLKTNYLRWRG